MLFKQDYVKVWSATYTGAHNPRIQQHWPAFVVVPQVMIPHQWVNTPSRKGSYKQAPQPTPELLMAKQLIDSLQKQYTGIDSHRLYITGVSQGGYGTWDMIERWPHYFAAAAPISGAGDPSKVGLLRELPNDQHYIWGEVYSLNNARDPVSGFYTWLFSQKN